MKVRYLIPHFDLYLHCAICVKSNLSWIWKEGEMATLYAHVHISWTDEVRAAHVLRPGPVWQLCLLLDYATLTTRQPGKVRPYRVSERWDDDVSLWCRRFSPLDFVVFLLCVSVNFFAHLLGTCLPSELDSHTVNPLCTWNTALQHFSLVGHHTQ